MAPDAYRFVLHDRDRIYAPWLDAAVTAMGVRILRTPVHGPTANAHCERLLGRLRRECLDYPIPFGEEYLRRIVVPENLCNAIRRDIPAPSCLNAGSHSRIRGA